MAYKVFELMLKEEGEIFYYSARTVIECLQLHIATQDMEFDYLHYEDDIREFPKNKWTKMFVDDEEPGTTFSLWMQTNRESKFLTSNKS